MYKSVHNKVKMKAVLYLRVSSEEQVSNFSLTNQEEYCRHEADRQGLEIDQIFKEEGASAKSMVGRDELAKLLTYCEKNKNKIGVVMVYRLDRLARETSDFLIIRKKLANLNIKIVSASEPVDDSATGKFVETLLASIAELDNQVKSERTKQGLKARFLAGYHSNKPPLGYTSKLVNEKSLAVPKEPEFSLVKRCFEAIASGSVSLSQLAVMANKWGLISGRNKKISNKILSRTLANPFYYGILKSEKYSEEVLGKHQPMISESLYFKARAVLDGRNTTFGKKHINKDNPSFPLRGLIKCGICNLNLVSGNCKGKLKKYPTYWCRANCQSGIQAKDLDKVLLKHLKKVQPKEDMVDLFFIMLKIQYQNRIEGLEKIRRNAESRENEVKTMISDLVEDRKKMPEEIYNELLNKYENQLIAVRTAKNDKTIEKYDLEGTQTFIRTLLLNLPRAYEVSTYSQKRILVCSIYPEKLVLLNKDILNTEINPIFRYIQNPKKHRIAFGVPDVPEIEHLFTFFNTLKQAYPEYKTQFAFN